MNSRLLPFSLALVSLLLPIIPLAAASLEPPKAKKLAETLSSKNGTRIDNYYWLRDRHNPEVIQYLQDENAYVDSKLRHLAPIEKQIFEEFKGRHQTAFQTTPKKIDGYRYYERYEDGNEYPIYCRTKDEPDAPEEVLLDGNQLKVGHDFLALSKLKVSPNNRYLLYSVDFEGSEVYAVFVKDLVTGEVIDSHVNSSSGDIEWAEDNDNFFYVSQDPVNYRPSEVYRHRIGTGESDLIFVEKDEKFWVSINKTKLGSYVMINTGSTMSSEVWLIKSAEPLAEPTLFAQRKHNVRYEVIDTPNSFFVITNLAAKNFRLMQTPIDNTTMSSWKEVIAHNEKILLNYVSVYKDYFVTREILGGLPQIRIIVRETMEEHYIKFDEPSYMLEVEESRDYQATKISYWLQSMKTPNSLFSLDLKSRTSEKIKTSYAGEGFNPDDYILELVHVPARDGAIVPVSIVRLSSTPHNGTAPLLINSYGAYGVNSDPYFDSTMFSLINRGFVYAIAHVRGGSELGEHWYENGKLLQKKNSFHDFIDCTKFLIDENYAAAGRIYATGGSAGGLLVAAIANMAPELYNGIIAEVPFVDVLTTMLDPSIPLTTSEYEEWGNPDERQYYEYIKSYSPYDNITAKPYPNFFITAGLNDNRVQYWEPAKWVAKLRDLKTDNNSIIFKTEMGGGHGGASGRFDGLKIYASIYAFILDLEGMVD